MKRVILAGLLSCFFLGLPVKGYGDSNYQPDPANPAGYQPVKPAGLPTSEVLTLAEQVAVQKAGEITVTNLSVDSPPGSDPLRQAEAAYELSRPISSPPQNTESKPAVPSLQSSFNSSSSRPVTDSLIPLPQGSDSEPQVPRAPKDLAPLRPVTDSLSEKPLPQIFPSSETNSPGEAIRQSLPQQNVKNTLPDTSPGPSEAKDLSRSVRSDLEKIFRTVTDRKSFVDDLDEPALDEKGKRKKAREETFEIQLARLYEKIRQLSWRLENGGQPEESVQPVYILDAVNFTDEIRAIDRLLNPPDRLHPWLKWLLYLNRVTPQMLELYQAALQERDRIYMLASKSKGRFKVRIEGMIMENPVYVWPDREFSYELVMAPDRAALVNSEHAASVPVSNASNPSIT